ncbi:hypothetical protein KAI04_01845 [Candidatus Pacearchaeota archaeon]|nr:hypothetical protein [Candidatus Pacearchaeota archaeon]
MKKSVGLSLICFSFILVLCLSLISAGWFSDLFKKAEITGEVGLDFDTCDSCQDAGGEWCVGSIDWCAAGLEECGWGGGDVLRTCPSPDISLLTDCASCRSEGRVWCLESNEDDWCAEDNDACFEWEVSVSAFYCDFFRICNVCNSNGWTWCVEDGGESSCVLNDVACESNGGTPTNFCNDPEGAPGSEEEGLGPDETCYDNDNLDYYNKGYIEYISSEGINKILYDYCIGANLEPVLESLRLNEASCGFYGTSPSMKGYDCPNGCFDGACVIIIDNCDSCQAENGVWCIEPGLNNWCAESDEHCGDPEEGVSVESCSEIDFCESCKTAGGVWCVDLEEGENYCSAEGEDCSDSDKGGASAYSCIAGEDCFETDGLEDQSIDYFNKGDVNVYSGLGYFMTYEEKCLNLPSNSETWNCAGDNCGVMEYFCEEGKKVYEIVNCPNGCVDGACIEEITEGPGQYLTCERCTDSGFTWCADEDVLECVSDPVGCVSKINFLPGCTTPTPECVKDYSWGDLRITDENIKKYLRSIKAECGLTFEIGEVLDELPLGYEFNIQGRKVIKVLNITSNNPDLGADLNITLNESEFTWPLEDLKIYVEKTKSDWDFIADPVISATAVPKVYDYVFKTNHFSLFLITEPDYCGNNIYELDSYEECDWSVPGTTNCNSECICEDGYDSSPTGECEESPEDTPCLEEGDEYCSGYTFYECGSDLKWDKKGIVLDECGVKCFDIGNNSCQGEFPLKCGSDYQWDIQSKINGLCGYIAPITPSPSPDDEDLRYCGNGYCGYNEDESNCPEDCTADDASNKWMLPLIIGVVSLLILLIIIVLFKIYYKEKRGSMPPPNRRIPPMHRPGPKRAPGRPQEVRTGQIGRPPVRKVSPGGYAVRKYPN